MTSEKVARDKPIPEYKVAIVKELTENINNHRTILIASCKGLPGRQFHDIKKKLRGKAEMKVAKKSAVLRSIDNIEKGSIKNLKEHVDADVVILFSDLDPFELSGILLSNRSKRNAKAGDISPEDIEVEAGMTDLPPGPAISELGSVGLKVKVSDGKLEIMQNAVIIKEGEEVNANVASVLGKLDIAPITVGFMPVAAYDASDDAVYADIVIDQEGTLEAMREMLGKALGFAVNLGYPTKETISMLLGKAAMHEKALSALSPKEEEKTETSGEEEQKESTEEGKEESPGNEETEQKPESEAQEEPKSEKEGT